MQKPTVGRIVHYQAYGTPGGEFPSVPRAAIITEVGHDGIAENFEATGEVGLCVMNPTGLFLNRGVPYSETPRPGCWNWPPREP
jgi:hypothetical protein